MIPNEPPRIRLAHLPTPIERFPRISQDLWIKRDDFTGSGLSGNKIRKLEYLLADAQIQGANVIVTAGDIQSNHARATAIAAKRLGLDAVLILEGEAETRDHRCGNLFLGHLVGAKVLIENSGRNLHLRLDECGRSLIQEGKKPYLIPVGGSNEVGVWGYIRAAAELHEQCQEMDIHPDRIVLASGSCGTQVGMLLGLKLAGWSIPLTGIAISPTAPKKRTWAWNLLQQTVRKYDLKVNCSIDDIELFDYSGDGYAKSRPEELSFISRMATHGLLLDPVYTGKGLYGLSDLRKRQRVGSDEKVLFVHTGGLPGLLAKADGFGDLGGD